MIKAIKAINKTTKSKQSVRGINILRKSHNFHDMKNSRASSGKPMEKRNKKQSKNRAKALLDPYGSDSKMSKTVMYMKKQIPQHSYNLVLTDSNRYLEPTYCVESATNANHVQTMLFDRIINRTSFLNSSLDVNEKRFQVIKDPENWTKNKRVSAVRLDKGIKQNNISDVFKDRSKSKVDSLNYNPNKEVTMEKTILSVPQFELNNKKLDRSEYISICRELRPEYYDYESAKDKQNRVKGFYMKAQKTRDMKMYKQTEAYQNIMNDNAKYDYIKSLCSTFNFKSL